MVTVENGTFLSIKWLFWFHFAEKVTEYSQQYREEGNFTRARGKGF